MMSAAGRGQFYKNLSNGLSKAAAPQPRSRGRGKSKVDREMICKTRALQIYRNPVIKPCSLHNAKKVETAPKKPQKITLLERLPSEVLMKVLSYLDGTSLHSLSYVNKLFCRLANNNLLWYNIYSLNFGLGQPWGIADQASPAASECPSSGFWKQKYFKALAGQEVNKWRPELRHINPYTGLPRQTEWVLRKLNVCWLLKAQDCFDQNVMLEPSNVYYFDTSVILHWSNKSLPYFNHIRNLELHGLRKEKQLGKKPLWTSLMLKLDVTQRPSVIGRDDLLNLMFLSPGFIVGIWRNHQVIAFIMVCLHLHRLMERSLFGSPVSPYIEPAVILPQEWSHFISGCHGYSLHLVLHNTGAEMLSEYFPDLSCQRVESGLMALSVVCKSKISCHRSLSGKIRLPWKIEELAGAIENCCFMTLTLLDEFERHFWCLCAPVVVSRSRAALSSDYGGEHYLMEYFHGEGQVKMKLVWLQDEKQLFLIDLIVFVPVAKINRYFCTNY